MKQPIKPQIHDITDSLKALRLNPKKVHKHTKKIDPLNNLKNLYLKSFIPRILVTDHKNFTRTLSESNINTIKNDDKLIRRAHSINGSDKGLGII